MNLVDSSGWLEYFTNGPNATVFARPIEQVSHLVVPSITITEVLKLFLQRRTEQEGLQAIAHMRLGHVVPLDAGLAMHAAKLGYDLKLPLADSIILAAAQFHDATLWTQDEDFCNLPGVRYIPKP